jgi:hypothetical protein
MAYEELFTDLLKAEREEDATDALTIFGLEKFSDSNWLPYGGIENNYGIIGAQQADRLLLPMVDSLGSKLAELEQA